MEELVRHILLIFPKWYIILVFLCFFYWVLFELFEDEEKEKEEKPNVKPPINNGNKGQIVEIITEPKQDQPKPVSIFFNPSNFQINGTKISYIRAVINWCRKNIPHPTKSLYPLSLEVKYYNHKNHHGVYYTGSRTIRVYVNNHGNIGELTDTVIHEYHHYMYMRSTTHQNEYNRLTNQKGYKNNPYEIAARECASKYYKACMKDLYELGYLK